MMVIPAISSKHRKYLILALIVFGLALLVTRWANLLGTRGLPRPPIGTQFTVTSTAYAPSPYQTDASPCITASQTRVRPGVVAYNHLPKGTLIKILRPEYEDWEFIVEDRTAPGRRNLDIYMAHTSEALQWGKKTITFEIIDYVEPGHRLRQNFAVDQQVEEMQTVAKETMQQEDISLAERISFFFANFLGTQAPADVDRFDVDCSPPKGEAEGDENA